MGYGFLFHTTSIVPSGDNWENDQKRLSHVTSIYVFLFPAITILSRGDSWKINLENEAILLLLVVVNITESIVKYICYPKIHLITAYQNKCVQAYKPSVTCFVFPHVWV